MTEELLTIKQLKVHVGERLLLQNINLSYAKTGFYVVMGQVGVGKSTLMSVFEGKRVADVVTLESDDATFNGRPLSKKNHPVVIKQATRSEQVRRSVSASTIRRQIDEALALDPAMLCLDEPCAMVAHDEAMPILERLKEESKRRAIVMVTHNSEHARLFADWMVLLGGGEVVEQNTPEVMFSKPASKITKQFLKTGGMTIPRPDAHARTLAPEFRGVPDLGEDSLDTKSGPIAWIVRKSFAVANEAFSASNNAEMLEELKLQGVSAAVLCDYNARSLRDTLEAAGIKVIVTPHQPENAPKDIRENLALAAHIQHEIAQGHKVIALGTDPSRTKTLAAIQLVHMGITVQDAVKLLNSKIAGNAFTVPEEQFLWDLELVLDIDSTSDQGASPLYAVK